MKKIILTQLLYIIPFVYCSAQIQIEGKVSTIDDKPLAGVTIKTIGSNRYYLSDNDGGFLLNITNDDRSIEVSHIGYKIDTIRVLPKPNEPLLVRLHRIVNELEEVVVSSGYQTLSKERSTGSFSFIDNKEFNEQIGTDVLSRLPAIANGLSSDHSASSGRLMVRGLSTIRGPKEPLIIVDNFPYEGDVNNLNPNDIQDITILKDASATSIWGARAGNGVIVITTKKGKLNRPITIDFNGYATIGAKPDLSYIPKISTSDFIDVEEMLYEQGYFESRINSTGKPPLSPIIELLIKNDGDLTNSEYRKETDRLRTLDVRNQYEQLMYRNSLNQQYSLNASGGTENFAWSASGGFDKNIGNVDDRYERNNLRFQNLFRPSEKFEFNVELYYTSSKTGSGKFNYGDIKQGAYDLYPYAEFVDSKGNALPIYQKRQTYIDQVGEGQLKDWKIYPLEDYKHNRSTNSINDVLINTGFDYRLIKGLSASLKYQYEWQQSNRRNLRDENSYFTRDLINSYTQIDATDESLKYIIPEGGIYDFTNDLLQSHNVRGQLNMDFAWQDHEIYAITGAEIRNAKRTGENHRLYGFNNDIYTFEYVDHSNLYPEFITGTKSYIPRNQDMRSQTLRFVSFYGNGSYSYKKKYILSASLRRDASNLFGLNANDKWNPFWSVGGSWDVSKEDFFNFKLMSSLRLRATYGFSGNIDPTMSSLTTIFYVENSPFIPGAPFARFDNYANPELRWETSNTFNLGIDFNIKNDRFTGSLDYYSKKGDNLFGYEQLDYTSGIPMIMKNSAKMKGKGIDLELRSLNIVHPHFSWSTHFNFNYNTDEVVDYYLTSERGSSFIASNIAIAGIKGKPVYSVLSFKWAGLDPETGDPLGYFEGSKSKNYSDLTGSKTTVNDMHYHGPTLPQFFGSLGNTFSYKNLALSLRLTYKLGHYFRKSSINYGNLFNRNEGHADFADRWQKPGDENLTDVPSLVYPINTNRDVFYSGAEVNVGRADHIRLQYINLSYQLKSSVLNQLRIQNVRLFFSAQNLGVLWAANDWNIDPDYNGYNTLKPSKTYSIGLNASFR